MRLANTANYGSKVIILECTVQLNLNLIEYMRSKGTTSHVFHFTCMQAFGARKIDDIKPSMQSSRVCTRRVHDARMHVRNANAKFVLCVHAYCKPRTAE